MDIPQGLSEYITTRLIPIRNLSRESQRQLLRNIVVETHPAGSYLFQQGDIDDNVYYLVSGKINMMATDQSSFLIDPYVEQALYPIGQMQPRQYTAQVLNEAQILKISKFLFDALVESDKADPVVPDEGFEVDAGCDWMTQMLESRIFASVPPKNIQKIFELFEEVTYRQKDRVVEQGTEGDYFYIIKAGKFEVSRRVDKQLKTFRLATLGEGDTFGEESLLGDMPRNATVTAITDGTLMRITKDSFLSLIRDPAIKSLNYSEAMEHINNGCVWLDVRSRDEYRKNSLAGSLNFPLDTLRIQSSKLDTDQEYIVYCDNGSRSAIAAYLLLSKGFTVNHLQGGVMKYQALLQQDVPEPPEHKERPAANYSSAVPDGGIMELAPRYQNLLNNQALVQAILSRQTDSEQLSRTLSLVLTSIFRQLEQAVKEKTEAELARNAAERKLAELQLLMNGSPAGAVERSSLASIYEANESVYSRITTC